MNKRIAAAASAAAAAILGIGGTGVAVKASQSSCPAPTVLTSSSVNKVQAALDLYEETNLAADYSKDDLKRLSNVILKAPKVAADSLTLHVVVYVPSTDPIKAYYGVNDKQTFYNVVLTRDCAGGDWSVQSFTKAVV